MIYRECILILYGLNFASTQFQYWEHFGNDAGGTRYSSADQIDGSNVEQLRRVWTYRYGMNPWGKEMNSAFTSQATPLVIDDGSGRGVTILVFCTPYNKLIALRPDTGKEIWTSTEALYRKGGTCRGVASWLDPLKEDGDECRKIIYMPTKLDQLMAVDAANGKRCKQFGVEGFLNLTKEPEFCGGVECIWFSNPPVIIGDVLTIGAGTMDFMGPDTPKGRVPGFDARTGVKLWTFNIIPVNSSDPAYGTYLDGVENVGSGNAWAPLSADTESGVFYVPTSSASGDHQGLHRRGDNHYCDSVVALDAKSGQLKWFKQLIHHNLWDYDLNAQPVVSYMTVNGTKTRVVIQTTKMGFVYVFKAETGEPIFEIKENEVPQTSIEGEYTSKTQPFPKDEFLRLSKTSINLNNNEDLWGFDESSKKYCENLLENVDLIGQVFTPPKIGRGTLIIPGVNGGAGLGGITYDPVREIGVVTLNHFPAVMQLFPKNFNKSLSPPWCSKFNGPYVQPNAEFDGCRGWNILDKHRRPCYKAPWVRMVGIDFKEKRIIWNRTVGFIKGANTSYGARWYTGWSFTTKTGLLFAANTEDAILRAYDITTGKVVWRDTDPYPVRSASGPITYIYNDKQYVLTSAGGHAVEGAEEGTRGDYVYAYSLVQPNVAAKHVNSALFYTVFTCVIINLR